MGTQSDIIQWYRSEKRDLPWRHTKDPYKIWLSEIILQQTRVQQGLPYYLKFVENFPQISDFANASEDQILSLWQGLGYYSRARNMHTAAKTVVNDFGGVFPSTYEEILSLKGVGPYTAAAIASFAFDLPRPVIDGNVFRVISRLFCILSPIDKPQGKKEITQALESIFSNSEPATWNQAIMEFGAMQCTPKKPLCETCPIQEKCLAFEHNKVLELPNKEGKVKVKKMDLRYFDFRYGDKLYIRKRTAGAWKNLYEYPVIEDGLKDFNLVDAIHSFLPQKNSWKLKNKYTCTHLLSHRQISAYFYTIYLDSKPFFLKSNIFEIHKNDLGERYPISTLISKYIQQLENYDK